ncbi:MAG TPA: hypothetical protein VHE37_07415 [Nevskiaceae bacterium]|nr:hypothetical protein [Nevskiaceae bacterium]
MLQMMRFMILPLLVVVVALRRGPRRLRIIGERFAAVNQGFPPSVDLLFTKIDIVLTCAAAAGSRTPKRGKT